MDQFAAGQRSQHFNVVPQLFLLTTDRPVCMLSEIPEKARKRPGFVARTANQQIQRDKLERLLEMASDLFAEKGYRQCGVQGIIDHLGLSKGGFYWHFESKDDLYCRICKAHCDRCRKAFHDLLLKPGPLDPNAILAASNDLLDWFIANPKEIRLMFDFCQEMQNEAVLRQVVELTSEWERVLAGLIQRCRDQGLMDTRADSAPLARIALVFFRGLLMDFNVRRDAESAKHDWQLFVREFFGLNRAEQ